MKPKWQDGATLLTGFRRNMAKETRTDKHELWEWWPMDLSPSPVG